MSTAISDFALKESFGRDGAPGSLTDGLLRGMIGRPGCTVFQMNGQPTAQNTRETGANGDLVGMRNWQNPEHVEELARIWNVEPRQIPSGAPPTRIMQIRFAEEGSLRFLWITATNPAVSLPELRRIRSILRHTEGSAVKIAVDPSRCTGRTASGKTRSIRASSTQLMSVVGLLQPCPGLRRFSPREAASSSAPLIGAHCFFPRSSELCTC